MDQAFIAQPTKSLRRNVHERWRCRQRSARASPPFGSIREMEGFVHSPLHNSAACPARGALYKIFCLHHSNAPTFLAWRLLTLTDRIAFPCGCRCRRRCRCQCRCCCCGCASSSLGPTLGRAWRCEGVECPGCRHRGFASAPPVQSRLQPPPPSDGICTIFHHHRHSYRGSTYARDHFNTFVTSSFPLVCCRDDKKFKTSASPWTSHLVLPD